MHTHNDSSPGLMPALPSHRQVSYSLPILCGVEIVFFPYVAALTDYSEHRKLVWLVGFSLTQLTAVLIAIMWHNFVWFGMVEG